MSLGPLHADHVSNLEAIQILTHFSSFGKLGRQWTVHFNHEPNFTDNSVIRRGSIRSLDSLSISAREFDRHVLPRRQAEDMILGQSNGKARRIMRQDLLANEGKFFKIIQRQDFGRPTSLDNVGNGHGDQPRGDDRGTPNTEHGGVAEIHHIRHGDIAWVTLCV